MEAIKKMQFIFKGYRKFTKNDKPLPALEGTLSGLNYLITGANSGIGFSAAKFAAERGAKVYLICRNKGRGDEAVQKIKKETQNQNVHLILGEMGQKKQLDKVVQEIKEKVDRIDVLVHNAGCMINERQYTSDKMDKNFATNTFSVYYLTKKCLPFLHDNSRVIVVSSGGMLTQKLVTDDLNMENPKEYDGTTQYARNKRQQVCLIQHFAKQNQDKGFFVTMHPGWVDTDAVRTSMPDFYEKFKNDLKDTDEGADTINYLAIAPYKDIKTGQFYYNRSIADKHLTIAGTSYGQKQTNALILKLQQLCH